MIHSIYQRQIKYLDMIIKNNKVPHAFLFHGPDQAVQKNIAQAMVFIMNQPGSGWPDFEDSDSQLAYQIKSESQPDVFMVKKLEDKKAVGIAQIRELKSFVSRSPLNLTTKAVIVTEAESLTEESWNALLKTLEEPAPNTVMFLISRSLRALPKTILSRVLTISFPDSGHNSKLKPKDDIILSKLVKLDQFSVLDRFNIAEELALSDNKLEIIDDWLLLLRARLLGGEAGLSNKLGLIAQTKNILASTNANPRLTLENLFLKI